MMLSPFPAPYTEPEMTPPVTVAFVPPSMVPVRPPPITSPFTLPPLT